MQHSTKYMAFSKLAPTRTATSAEGILFANVASGDPDMTGHLSTSSIVSIGAKFEEQYELLEEAIGGARSSSWLVEDGAALPVKKPNSDNCIMSCTFLGIEMCELLKNVVNPKRHTRC